jgi:putative transcriptional regulator
MPSSDGWACGTLEAPGLVVAMPQLADPNFRRSVVLLLNHGAEGSLGLVINRPSPISVAELCRSQDLPYRGSETARMMIGGPVEIDHHLLVLHGEEPCFPVGSESEVEIAEGVRLVTALPGLAQLAERSSARFRCYAGYAGWGPGQLEGELEQGAWVPLPSDPQLVFAADASMVWERALREGGIDPITLVPGGASS